jgi:hypothetical protein
MEGVNRKAEAGGGSISNLNPTMIEMQVRKMMAKAVGIKMLVFISHRN